MTVKLLLVGGGKMGSAMMAGWLKGSLKPEDVLVVEPFEETRKLLKSTLGVDSVADASEIPDDAAPETVVLAVKPQMMDEAIGDFARFAGPDCVYVSVAAGKTIAYFEEKLGPEAAIVRAMPNTPAAVGRGITVGYPNHLVSDTQRKWADELLQSFPKSFIVQPSSDAASHEGNKVFARDVELAVQPLQSLPKSFIFESSSDAARYESSQPCAGNTKFLI